MSLEAIVGIQAELKPSWNDHSQMASLDALKHEDLESGDKHLIPGLSIDNRLKLSNTVDEVTRQKIRMNFFKGTTTAAFLYKNGIVVCADSRATGGEFIFSGTVRKIIPINSYILGTMAGGAADCAYWERVLAEQCRLFELRNREPISVAAASKLLANMLYNYKGMGLSLGTMISGWDPKRGPQIYMVDNDARRLRGDLFSVGSGSVYAYAILDKEYRFDMTDEEAYDLGRRAIFHATHRDGASGGKVRIYAIHKDGWKVITEEDNSILYDRYSAEGSMSVNH